MRGWRATRQLLLDAIGRPLLLVFWSFVLWGSLMALAYGRALLRSGFELRRLLPPAGTEGRLLVWLNLASAVLAVFVWALAGFAWWQARGERG